MTEERTLRTSRTLPYQPKEVYAAFASADLLAAWWGPEGFSNTFDIFEFTPGGRWTFVMHGPDGTNYLNESLFVTLEPDTRIVIRHVCPPHFTLTVELTSVSDGTHLTWEQVFEDAKTARAVRQVVGPANEQNIDRLSRVLSKVAGAASQVVQETVVPAINLNEKLSSFSDHWQPRVVGQFNGHDLLVAKVKGQFVWHTHEDTDDFFMVIQGRLTIQMRKGDVTLGPGEIYVVPRGVEHCPIADEEAHILLIESKGTPNTGDAATAAPRREI